MRNFFHGVLNAYPISRLPQQLWQRRCKRLLAWRITWRRDSWMMTKAKLLCDRCQSTNFSLFMFAELSVRYSVVIITVMKPRPKTLGKIRQRKLVARDHVRALGHTLVQMQLDLRIPSSPLRAVLPTEEARCKHNGRPFRWSFLTGAATWEDVYMEQDPSTPRVVLSPDEGSPMFSAFVFMATKGCLVHLARDELHLRGR